MRIPGTSRASAPWTFAIVASALFGAVVIAPVRAVTLEPSGAQLPPPEERFERATIRRGITVMRGVPIPAATMATIPPARALGMVTFDEREFIATAVPIQELIERAYGIGMSGLRPLPFTSIEGVPSWTERFDIEARMPRPIARVRGRQEAPELRVMLQHLLADRFRLVARWEPRQKLVYELLREGPLGPRLRPSAPGNGGYWGERTDSTRAHRMAGLPLSTFIGNLQLDLRRPIIDLTGLEGPHSLELEYSAPRQNGADVTLSAVPANQQWQVFSDALREQLGLRLEPRTTSEDVLVIDRITLPSYDSP